jgi:hypothetical protein
MDKNCKDCDKYKERGHNYCRMCGFYFKQGYVENVAIADAYHVNEKFCGYCGGPPNKCKCVR